MALYNYLTENGTVLPDTSAIKDDVENEYREIYGADFVVDSQSQQGREIDAEITSRISVARNNAFLANQMNPNLANGVFLDADYALMGGQRDQKERSTSELTLGGVAGTPILAGASASDDDGNVWISQSDVTLDGLGVATASFRSEEYGPINAATGEINTIAIGVLGWETVTNPDAAIPGKLEQSDQSTRRQRKIEIGQNSKSNAFSIIAAINSLEGVAGIAYRENISDAIVVIDGVTMAPHSNYICVDGGVNSEIADAYQIKSGGSNYNGSVVVPYTDPDSGQVIQVKFDRPTEIDILCRVTARVGSSLDAINDIKNAVLAYAAGEISNELGFYLGEDISAFEIGSAVNVSLPDVFISKCEIALKSSGVYSTDTLPIEIFEKGAIIKADIDVVII